MQKRRIEISRDYVIAVYAVDSGDGTYQIYVDVPDIVPVDEKHILMYDESCTCYRLVEVNSEVLREIKRRLDTLRKRAHELERELSAIYKMLADVEKIVKTLMGEGHGGDTTRACESH